jgi:hypothetical protein
MKVYFGNGNGAATFYMGSNDTSCADRVHIHDTRTGEGIVTEGSNRVVGVDTWYHLAYVYSGTSASIYVNGTLSATSVNVPDSSKANMTRYM